MIRFLANPYAIGGIIAFFAVSFTTVYIKGRYDGAAVELARQEEATKAAEQEAAVKVVQTKKDAQIVYKYIRKKPDNNVNCPISFDVIDRLPGPGGKPD